MSRRDGGVDVDIVGDCSLSDPVLIEGLPGVGYVGALVVEHILEEFDSELVARIHSEHFPPQVIVEETGVGALVGIDIHAVSTDAADMLLLSGEQQAATGIGHYRISEAALDFAADHGVGTVYALGGVPTGELIENYDVLGAVSDESIRESLESAGVLFRENEPAGGIVGISGLLLGIGGKRGFEAACLMGETSGYLVDPKSAKAVLTVLESLLGFEIDYARLDDRAEEMEEVVGKIQELEEQNLPTEDDLRYIG